MDSNLLKAFITVKNEKSISSAAKKLGYTQSNITSRIKQLEKNLSYSLFHRTNRGVVLTNEGEKLYPFAVDIVKKVEEATSQMRNINHQEILKMGTTQSNATIRLIPIIEQLNKDFQDMKIEFNIDSSLNLVEQLLDYQIDIAFINGNPNHKDLEVLNIFKDEIYFVEPKDKEAKNNLLVYRDTCAYCLHLQDYAKQNSDLEYKTLALQNYELMLGLTKAGYGVTLLSKSIIDKFGYTDKLKLTRIQSDFDAHLVCRKDYRPMIENYLRTKL